MGLSSLRRHRGGYLDRALVKPEPSKEQLAEQLEAEKAARAALEAQVAAMAKASSPKAEPAAPAAPALAEDGAAAAAPKPRARGR